MLSLSATAVRELFTTVRVTGDGFRELKAELRDGHIGFVGRFASGEYEAEVSFKLALLVHDRAELIATVYDTRAWVASSCWAATGRSCARGTRRGRFRGLRATAWESRPVEQFFTFRHAGNGLEVPDTDQADLVSVEISREQIVLVCGRDVNPAERQSYERAARRCCLRS